MKRTIKERKRIKYCIIFHIYSGCCVHYSFRNILGENKKCLTKGVRITNDLSECWHLLLVVVTKYKKLINNTMSGVVSLLDFYWTN
jgi:hypothetical protein